MPEFFQGRVSDDVKRAAIAAMGGFD